MENAALKPKVIPLASTLILCPWILLTGCGKAAPKPVDSSPARSASRADRAKSKDAAEPILTKEEVGAILGEPVTSIEGTGTSLTYKTATLLLETGIDVEEHDSVADAVQAMQGAHTATGFLGGEADVVPGLGDEAFFGAMSFLYGRKGDVSFTITPPNLQQLAGMKAYEKVRDAKSGDEMGKAMKELQRVQGTDPLQAGLEAKDAPTGAVAVIKASSKKQGTEYEKQARAMALALARKLVEKL